MTNIDSKKKALLIAKFAQDKKAEDIAVIDLRKIPTICDYFVIVSGSSNRKVKAIAEFIEEESNKRGIKVWHVEGKKEACWILLDCGDIVVHIFYKEARDFYNLERLWADAPVFRDL